MLCRRCCTGPRVHAAVRADAYRIGAAKTIPRSSQNLVDAGISQESEVLALADADLPDVRVLWKLQAVAAFFLESIRSAGSTAPCAYLYVVSV